MSRSCVALLAWVLLYLCSNVRSQAPQVTPIGGAAQDANTIDTFVMSFNITPDVPPSSIYWLFQSQGLGTPINITNNSFRTLSADKHSITLDPVITLHEGVYTLMATSGSEQGSASIALNVRTVGFITTPQDITEHERQNATFNCFGTGDPTPTVMWFFKDNQLPATGSKYRIAPFGDSNFGALTIFNLVYNDHGTYTCMVSNGFRAINDSAILQIQEFPVIAVTPEDTNTTAGGLARLFCNATGFPIPNIAWYKNNTPIAELNDPRIAATRTEVAENLIAVGVLSIQGPVLSHNGMYSCNASNSLKTAEEVSSNKAVLNVQYPPSVAVNVTKVTVNQSFPASFSCEAFGIPPPSLQWISSITNSAVQHMEGTVNIIMNSFFNGSDLEIRTSQLVFNSTVRSPDEANYTCRAQNGIPNYISSSPEAVVELIVQVPPITTFPGNNPNQVLGIVHQQVTISIAIDIASPDVLPAHTEWQFKAPNAAVTAVLENTRYMFSESRRSLTITDLTHEDEGQYIVTVRNPAGSDTITVNLAIEAAPEIIESPQSANVLQGANATLICNATSEPTHSVTWSKNDSAIDVSVNAGKYSLSNSSFGRSLTSSLTIHNVVMADTANYTCTVTNLHGTQAATAYLEIQVPPAVLINPVSGIGIVGQSSTLVCQANGSPIPSIQWWKDGQNVTSSSRISIVSSANRLVLTSNITITNLDFSDTGNYTCIASNNLAELQTDNSPPALLTVNRPSIIMNTVALPVVNESQNVNMTCVVFGLPKPTVTWSRFDSNNLTITAMGNSKFTVYETSVVPVTGGVMVNSILEINNINGTDTGNYTCSSVNYAHGTDSPANVDQESFHVLVQTSPVVVSQMSTTEIGVRGRNITLTFDVTGDEPKVLPGEVRWYFTDGSVTTEVVSSSRIGFSADRLVLTITNLSISDQGNYTLNATNIIGTGLSSVFLDVQISPVVNESEPIVRVLHGADAVFQCVAVSEPVHITNWQLNGNNLTNSSKYIINGIDTISSTLTVTDVSLNDEGNYTCRVSNLHGVDFAPSELQVQVPPVVFGHPENMQVLVTRNVTINCQATGVPPPSIIWLKEGNTIPSTFVTSRLLDASTTSSNLTLTNTNLSDATNYTCMATNNLAEAKDVESMPATITVLYPPQAFSLSQTTYIKNESDTFAIECQAFGIPPPTLYWIPGPLNVTTLLGQDNYLIQKSDIERLVNLSSSFTSRFLNTSNTFCTDEVTGSGSDPASVCRQQSQAAANESTSCPMNAICASVPCGLDITTSSRMDADGRVLSVSKLTICKLSKLDEGALSCVAVNNISNVILTPEASAANLIVQVRPLVIPTRTTVVAFRDRSTTLEFVINSASPDVTPDNIEWTFEPNQQEQTLDVNSAVDSRYQFSQDRRSLNISSLRRNDSGSYILTATNEAGVHSATIELIVEALPDILEFRDDGVNITSGSDVQLPCYANGEPLQSVKWDFFFMGTQQYTIEYIVNNTGGPVGPKFTSLVPGLNTTDLQSMFSIAGPNQTARVYGMLTINNINILQAGEYRCNLTNVHGSENRIAQVAVQLFPSVVEQPADRTCVQGGICAISCSTRGVPAPQIEWFREDGKVSSGGVVTITNTSSYSVRNTTLRIDSVSVENASNYFCNATNVLVQSSSAVSQEANVVVHYPASVVSGLQNTVRNETDSAYFTCGVIGIPRPNIVWARANSAQGPFTVLNNSSKTEISETEALLQHNQIMVNTTLEVRNLRKEDDEAYYRCTAVNDVENLIQAESVSTAHLVVQVPPVVTPVSTASHHLRNSTVSIEFSLNSRVFPAVQLSNIQWIYTTANGSEILDTSFPNNTRYNFSSNLLSLTITNLQVADDGNYSLMASNEAGIHIATYNLTVFVIAKLLNESGIPIKQATNTNFSLICVADGIPEPRILWNRNGVIIDQNLLSRLTISMDIRRAAFRSDIIGHKGREWGVRSTLTITEINGELDDASYGCQANNIDGITATLQDPSYMLTVERDNINFCETLSPCQNGGRCENLETSFQCFCPSTFGGSTCENVIIQTEEPRITMGPSTSFLDLFKAVTLTCTSTGIPAPTIQWFKDGIQLPSTRITGQNLVFQETKLTDRGFYHCVAENSVGRVESSRAVLNFNNIVQYSAVLSRPLSQLASSNITQAISSRIDELNSRFGGKPVGDNQFFFVQIQDSSQIKNNTENVTVPIILTILTTANKTQGETLRLSVLQTVGQFGFQIVLTGEVDVRLFDRCPQETTILQSPDGDPSLNLNITWPETILGEIRTQPCPCEFNISSSSALIAVRRCGGDFNNGAEWGESQDEPCRFSVTARRLCLLAMQTNPILRAGGLDNITRETDNIRFTEITIATSGSESVLGDARNNTEVADRYINVINNILNVNISEIQMSQDTSNSSGRLNAGLGSVIQSLSLNNTSSMNITRQNFNIQLTDTDPMEFDATNFNNPNLTLPQNLLKSAMQDGTAQNKTSVRIAQSTFNNNGLYLGRDIGQREVASPVFDFTVFDLTIRNLSTPINITLRQEMNEDVNRSLVQAIECTFWDQSADGGRGNWSTDGCRRINSTNVSDPVIICQCDHLTSFAVLLDVAPRPPAGVVDQLLEVYSIIGCVVSLVCLFVTAITYLASPKLRQSEASQLLLNLSFGLMGLYIAFIVAVQGNKITNGVCAVVGFFVHFFLLVVFFAMGAEAVDLFMKLVIVLGPKIQKFTLKTILVSWVAPLFIVLFCFAPNYNHYTTTFYCGPSKEPFYFGVIIPFGAIYIFNFTIFTVIMISLIRKQRKSNRLSEAKTKGRGSDTKQQFRIAITIAVLFGLGWIFGLAGSQSLPEYISVPFQILFTTLVGFQGLFIFLLYVIFSPNARKEWKRWILRKEESRKGRPDHSSTSGAYSSRSRQTKQSTVSNYKRNQLKKGTLYHNVYSSTSVPSSTVPQSIAEYSTYEPAVMSSHAAAIEELKHSVAKNERELNQTNYLNPLDEDGLSMKSEMDDTHSLMHETTFVLPSQEDDDQYSQEEDPSQPEAADTAQTTFINPFASKMEEDVLLPSQESSDYLTPANNGQVSFSMNPTASQSMTQNSNGDEDTMLLAQEGTKL